MSRAPVVAGKFYEQSPPLLKRTVHALIEGHEVEPEPVIGLLVPHAAYAFSGRVAGAAYARIQVPDIVVVLGPNHTGLGHPGAVGISSPWLIPGGHVEVASDVAERLIRCCKELAADDVAHVAEHSIEVQLPLLIEKNPSVKIVPVCLRTMSYEACERIGLCLAEVLRSLGGRALLIASSDMNHHEPLHVSIRKDRLALERFREVDARGLFDAVMEHHISMCGYVPTVTMLIAARAMGARYGEVVSYGTSADVDADSSSVVGYAAGVLKADRNRVSLNSLRY